MFFVKQKTAYAMRISDWSSYVCSSDLLAPRTKAPYDLLVRIGGVQLICLDPRVTEGAQMEGFQRLLCRFGKHSTDEVRGFLDRERSEGERVGLPQIGRASCRERVCQYV